MSDGLNIAVLTVSDTRTADTDTSGQFLEDALLEAGHVLASRAIVVDDIYQIRARLSAWIADSNLHAILVTGGTGFSGRDSTPEAVLHAPVDPGMQNTAVRLASPAMARD